MPTWSALRQNVHLKGARWLADVEVRQVLGEKRMDGDQPDDEKLVALARKGTSVTRS